MYVSSLHGRVYRQKYSKEELVAGFLPTREGVSMSYPFLEVCSEFPPYTGGCIDKVTDLQLQLDVSSLHGRVYRVF